MSAIPPKVRQQVKDRAMGCCERCGTPLDTFLYSLQHRRARSMGGSRAADTNTAVNLAALCGSATTPSTCHQWAETHPEAAIEGGWRVPSWADPAATPIDHWEHGLVYLTGDGRYTQTPPAASA